MIRLVRPRMALYRAARGLKIGLGIRVEVVDRLRPYDLVDEIFLPDSRPVGYGMAELVQIVCFSCCPVPSENASVAPSCSND